MENEVDVHTLLRNRILILALSAVVVLGCAACAPGTPPGPPSGESAASSASSSSAASDASSSAAESGSGAAVDESGPSASGASESTGGAGAVVPVSFEEDPAYDELRAGVEGILSDAVIDAGVVFVNLSDTAHISGFSINGDTPLVAASMIKLAVLAEFLDEVESGKISMDEPYAVRAEDIVGGTGSVQSSPIGTVYTYAELARLMICESDNVAANVLIGRMGMDAVNEQAEALGLSGTRLVRLMMDEEAMADRQENLMAAQDAAVLLTQIWRGQLVSETASRFALEALEAQSDATGLLQGLPKGTAFAHKTGTLALVENDGGIVEGDKPYVLVVFCSGAEESTALDLMSRISEYVNKKYE